MDIKNFAGTNETKIHENFKVTFVYYMCTQIRKTSWTMSKHSSSPVLPGEAICWRVLSLLWGNTGNWNWARAGALEEMLAHEGSAHLGLTLDVAACARPSPLS